MNIKYLLCAGFFIICSWVAAYVISWASQYTWAFINDSRVGEINWLSSKINYSKYRYPVYSVWGGEELKTAIKENHKPYAYSKNKEDKNKNSSHVNSDNYKWEFETYGGILTVSVLTSLIPFCIVLAFEFYPVTLFAVTIAAVIYLARFAMRGKKMFDSHVNNKGAHKD